MAGGVLVYFLGQSNDAAETVTETAVMPNTTIHTDIPYPEVGRISVAEARAQAEAGTAVILDVRDLSDYQISHAVNALSIPFGELPARYGELPTAAAILTYCT